MDRKFGIIGYPLGHSFSKKYFDDFFLKNSLFNCSYETFPIENIEMVEDIIASNKTLEGFSVTIPHKEKIIPFLDELEPLARRVGAVNCVKIIREGNSIRKIGYNTDVLGFSYSMKRFLDGAKPKALILGSGGASKAVCVALEEMEISYLIISRKASDKTLAYSDITPELLLQYKLIINTTPVGMFPKVEDAPNLPYHLITDEFYGFDLVYNPPHTKFMDEFKKRGAKFINGDDMLIEQAREAWAIYNKGK